MASLVPGYEYDIFISYRQKDNKGDRWVTEFVAALKTELEATFKEDVSIYFDENPHDGSLETHHVDKSLHRKLKCLIFNPSYHARIAIRKAMHGPVNSCRSINWLKVTPLEWI